MQLFIQLFTETCKKEVAFLMALPYSRKERDPPELLYPAALSCRNLLFAPSCKGPARVPVLIAAAFRLRPESEQLQKNNRKGGFTDSNLAVNTSH
jgi:hypothetical protein